MTTSFLNTSHKILSELSSEHTAAMTDTLWDVIIVGGGMVGATVALGLGQQGVSVLLLERQAVNTAWSDDLAYQVRVSALTRASEMILKNLGVWQGIEARRYHPFTAMYIWDEFTPGSVHFSAKDMGEANLGHTIENSVIQAALWEQVKACQNITVLLNHEIESLEFVDNQAWLKIENLGKFKTPLLVGADGAISQVRQLAFIGLETYDYEQCVVVGCVKTEGSNEDTCWQRYTSQGPFAYLSMGGNLSSIAWYLPLEKMQWALALSDKAFAEAISKASDYKLGAVIEVTERAAFPLTRRHAKHYVKANLALVGDAAHTIHPQAGLGVNLGLLDAAALVETVLTAKSINKAWGKFSVLRKYERWRRGDNAIIQRSMEGFDWLFKQDSSLKIIFRKAYVASSESTNTNQRLVSGSGFKWPWGFAQVSKIPKPKPNNG